MERLPRFLLSRWLPLMTKIAIVVFAFAGIVRMQQMQLVRPSLWQEDPALAQRQEAIRLQILHQMPTFGFNNLVADWTFLNFLQYYGDVGARSQTGFSLSPVYFDIITQLDPRFLDIYLFLSGSVSYQLGKPEQAIALMERGTRALSPVINPRAFQVWRLMGIDQLLLLGDIPGSIHSHKMAAHWVEGTRYQKLGSLFQGTAQFLQQDPNSIPVRFQSWASVYEQAVATRDRQTQARAQQEILQLGGEVTAQNGKIHFVLPNRALKPVRSKTSTSSK
ncbi:MAG: hypothetical protein ACKO24_01390 [Leptolyngbyaceae cyanobacterium]